MDLDSNMDTWRWATGTNIWRYDWQSEGLGYLKRMNETAGNTRYGIYFMGCKEWFWNFSSAWGVFDGFWNNDSGVGVEAMDRGKGIVSAGERGKDSLNSLGVLLYSTEISHWKIFSTS